MALNVTQIAAMVVVILIAAVLLISLTASAGSAVGSQGGGASCNLYCAVKDSIHVGPAMCGC